MLEGCGYIGLGSNLADPASQILRALESLGDHKVHVEEVSSLYYTEPVEAPPQPWFLNGVARVRSGLTPLDLLGVCQAIESSLGRNRRIRHGPRTIDLDLLLWGGVQMDIPELTLPHPHLHLRRFVLVPLAEIAPRMVHPRLGMTMAELLARCPDASEVLRVQSPPCRSRCGSDT